MIEQHRCVAGQAGAVDVPGAIPERRTHKAAAAHDGRGLRIGGIEWILGRETAGRRRRLR
jgi:hypothetical protein